MSKVFAFYSKQTGELLKGSVNYVRRPSTSLAKRIAEVNTKMTFKDWENIFFK